MGSAHVGTSGWSYGHWRGTFYPPGSKSAEWLEFYAQRFDCVELNATFYHLPLARTVAGWARRTPDNFLFCPKLSRYITHRKRLKDVAEALGVFMERMSPMPLRRRGPMLVQLGPTQKFDAERIDTFLALLRRKFPKQRVALEVRHESWMNEQATDILRKRRTAWVIGHCDGRWPVAEFVTADFTYLRFHGTTGRYAGNYPDELLGEYAEKCRRWLAGGLDVWAFFNNDAEGHAVANALRLREMIS